VIGTAAALIKRLFEASSITPHLFGWLIFEGHLGDVEKSDVILEHEKYGGPLKRYFEEMYHEALRCRWMASQK